MKEISFGEGKMPVYKEPKSSGPIDIAISVSPETGPWREIMNIDISYFIFHISFFNVCFYNSSKLLIRTNLTSSLIKEKQYLK